MHPALPNSPQAVFQDGPTCFYSRGNCSGQIAELTARQDDSPLAIVWIALDRIKQVNASLGHRGGDLLIARIAERLRNRTGNAALWFRMAGDEFAHLAPGLDAEQARKLAAELLGEIQVPLLLGELTLYPSASLGTAIYQPGESPSNFLERADLAANSAKRAGGLRVAASDGEALPGRQDIGLAHRELQLEHKLHLAIQQGELRLHYQPVIDSAGRILSVEALMRCADHELTPAEFIPIAEKTGLIIRLGEWSLLEGARLARRLDLAGQPLPVAVNVSPAQLATSSFPKSLHAALLCANVRPELLELELTESMFMDNSSVVQANLRAIQETGVRMAIDDFGTGYSCLANLKDISATKLKIDRAFVVSLPHDRRALSVVKGIARIGCDLGMEVVAEGVERPEQLDALLEAGIHSIQGHIHTKPMPEDTLLDWLKNRK